MFIYVNGEYVNGQDAKISPYDHGYLYGLGVFETFRVYEGHPFLLDDHIERLNEGIKALNISRTIDRKEVVEIVGELLQLNNLTNAYVRFNVSAGVGEVGLSTEFYYCPTIICFIKPLPAAPLHLLSKTIQFVSIPRNTPEGNMRLKSHHYLNNILAKREVGPSHEKEGIFLTKEGYLAEGIVSNVFFVKDRVVYTPCLSTGILNGITRKYVLNLCEEKKMKVKEGFYSMETFRNCDEAFLTNSIQEIISISCIDGEPKEIGLVTKLLHEEYKKDRLTRWGICEEGC